MKRSGYETTATRRARHELETRIACDRIRDEAHVEMLLLTSTTVGRMMYEYEVRAGIPAYDDAAARPSWRVRTCPGCEEQFWARKKNHWYCTEACASRAYQRARRTGRSEEEAA